MPQQTLAAVDGGSPLVGVVVVILIISAAVWCVNAFIESFKPRNVEIRHQGRTTITRK